MADEDGIRISPDDAAHIFRAAEGHFPADTPENRSALIAMVEDSRNFVMTDQFGSEIYASLTNDGREIWAIVRGNEIRNGGINQKPRFRK